MQTARKRLIIVAALLALLPEALIGTRGPLDDLLARAGVE
jgi:hypothetical protein